MILNMVTRYENARAAAEAVPCGAVKRTCHRALKRLGFSWFKQVASEKEQDIWSCKYKACGTFKGKVICTGVGVTEKAAWRNLLQCVFYAASASSLSEFFVKVDVNGIPARYKQVMDQVKDVEETA